MSKKKLSKLRRKSLVIHISKIDDRVDSRLIAEGIDVGHRSLFKLICRYQVRLETRGILRFEIAKTGRQGQPEKYALLNESQAIFLLTLSKNTDAVVEFKDRLTSAFDRLRKQAEHRSRIEWQQVRAAAALTYRLMSDTLKDARERDGKDTQFFHYANEARLVNWVLTGEFAPLSREQLAEQDLRLLEKLEYQNTLLLNRGLGRDERKQFLLSFAANWRIEHAIPRLKKQSADYFIGRAH